MNTQTEVKRYFAYATDPTALFVRFNRYYDDLQAAKKDAKQQAEIWGGCWAVTDTTLTNDRWEFGKMIEFGDVRAS